MVNILDPMLKTAHLHSMNNRQLLARGGECGCFHCLRTFDATEVTEWTDDDSTALCPFCQIDAVLSSQIDPIDAGFLRRMHDFWFGQTGQVDLSDELARLRTRDAAQ